MKTLSHAATRRYLDHPAVFIVAVLFAWAVCAAGTWSMIQHIEGVSKVDLPGAPMPKVDASSPTGYAMGQRRTILADVDTCQWIMHAQRTLHEGKWRQRWMPDDNAPVGRELHWSQSIIWWLIALGTVTGWITGLPAAAGIEVAAPWAGMAFLSIMLVIFPLAIRRLYGWLAAALGAMAMAFVYPFTSLFFGGCIDHHGFIALAGTACLLFACAAGGGWVARDPGTETSAENLHSEGKARRWFIASGFCGAVTLWLSAASAIPYFVGMGGALLVAAWFFPKNTEGAPLRFQPNLWRLWGVSAALGSLFFYLLEYFPNHLGWRLEINHPFYALALLGGGELLYSVTRSRVTGIHPFARLGNSLLFLASIGALLLIPILIHWRGNAVFVIGDPFIWGLHRDYIAEFNSLAWKLRQSDFIVSSLVFGPLPFLGFIALRLFLSQHLGLARKTILALPLGAALLTTALGCWQTRWYYIANGPWIAVLMVVVGCVTLIQTPLRFAWWEKTFAALLLGVMLVHQPFIAFYDAYDTYKNKPDIGVRGDKAIIIRDVAWRLRRSTPPGAPVPIVASGPTTTTWLLYYGGLRGMGTLYWENVAGLKTAAELYSAPTPEEARRLIQRHNVSYIALFSNEPLVFEYPCLWRGLPKGQEPEDTLSYGLATGYKIPPWARRLPYPISNRIQEGGTWAALFDVRQAGTNGR